MPERPTWRGHLKLSLVTCPIALFTAVSAKRDIRFNFINPDTGNRVRMRYMDAETGEEVERSDLVKGYQFAKDRYVIVSDEELDELRIPSSDTLEIEKFVEQGELDPIFFEQPYFVVPDGEAGKDAYKVIMEAMRQAKKVGVGRVVMSRRERVLALLPDENGLMGYTLREADDVRKKADFFRGLGGKAPADMVSIAAKILEQKSGEFDPGDFTDRYEKRIRELLDAKLKGEGLPEIEPVAEQTNVVDLMEALKKSLKGKAASDGEKRAGKDENGKVVKLPTSGKSRPAARATKGKPKPKRRSAR